MANLFQDLCSAFISQSGLGIVNSYDEYGNRNASKRSN